MQGLSWDAPVLPGMLDAWEAFNAEMLAGPPPAEVKFDWRG